MMSKTAPRAPFPEGKKPKIAPRANTMGAILLILFGSFLIVLGVVWLIMG